jgi:hypothetical protein
MIPFAPLLESPFQVGVRQSSQTGNFSDALTIWAMTSNAGHNIGIRKSYIALPTAASSLSPSLAALGGSVEK